MLPTESVQRQIKFFRGQRVMLDADLAQMYGVETKRLLEAVKRNAERFPHDFAFQLTQDEFAILRSQVATSSGKTPAQNEILRSQSRENGQWGGRRTAPYAFTEQGVAMLSTVLRSPYAISVSIAIMRAFVDLRRLVASNADLARKIDELDRRMTESEARLDVEIAHILEAIRQLLEPPASQRRPLGFAPRDEPTTPQDIAERAPLD